MGSGPNLLVRSLIILLHKLTIISSSFLHFLISSFPISSFPVPTFISTRSTVISRVLLPSLCIVSCPDPPSGGCGEREKEGLGNNPGWKCPGGMLWLRNN